MKNLSLHQSGLTFLFVLFSFFSCSKSNHTATHEEMERALLLQNKIKTIIEYKTSFLVGVKQPEQVSQEKHFDEKGFLISETDYNQDGIKDCMIAYAYDKNGNLILVNAINADSSFLFKETKTYDENNNRKKLYFFLPDGTYKYRNVATYDNEGRMTELAWYWPTGFKSKNKYEYDGRKKISDTEYDAKGNISYKWNYKYDANENLIEAIQYSPSGNINRKIIYEYSKYNLLTKESDFIENDLQSSISFLYDEKKMLSSKSFYSSSGRITCVFRYKYQHW